MIEIKSEREFLREIFAKIERGIYRIPIFQRNFVWEQQQVIDFFDSIWNGYPIGSILLWGPDKDMPSKDILTDKIIEEKSLPNYFVLDGRQRLSAFYGCVQDKITNIKEYNLYFNLDTEKFVYPNKENINLVKVSKTYDTFELLSWMQSIMENLSKDMDRARKYINLAKKLNSILQGYTVSEVYINNCSLKEAEIVFTRINSKGTPIDKSYMLQATSYRNGGFILSDKIKEMKDALKPYGFESLSNDDILNCFYKFVGKNFYDAKINDLEHLDLSDKLPQIKDTLCRSAKFLHDECYVLNIKVLPYIRQFIAMTWFFRVHKVADDKQACELRRWFLYTTYTRTFFNGSLSNVRNIFRRFEEFVNGRAEYAMEYNTVVPQDDMQFSFSLRNARSNFLILSLIWHYSKNFNGHLHYNGVYSPSNKKNPLYQIVCLSREDKYYLNNLFQKGENILSYELVRFALTNQEIINYRSKDYPFFEIERLEALQEIEYKFLKENGIFTERGL